MSIKVFPVGALCGIVNVAYKVHCIKDRIMYLRSFRMMLLFSIQLTAMNEASHFTQSHSFSITEISPSLCLEALPQELHLLFSSKILRKHIAETRALEIRRDGAFDYQSLCPLYHLDSSCNFIGLSRNYKEEINRENKILHLLALAIKNYEAFLLAQGYSREHKEFQMKKDIETARTIDLILLKTIIENDNFYYDTNYYTIGNVLKETHAQWPPECQQYIFYSTSAYESFNQSLEKRIRDHIDSINETPLREDYSIHASYKRTSNDFSENYYLKEDLSPQEKD